MQVGERTTAGPRTALSAGKSEIAINYVQPFSLSPVSAERLVRDVRRSEEAASRKVQ